MRAKILILPMLMAIAVSASAAGFFGSKPTGFRFFDNRLTLRPHVDISYNYDSNIDTAKHGPSDEYLAVRPDADFTWRGDRWELTGNIWYSYKWYNDYSKQMDGNNFGESLSYAWSNVGEDGKGWNLLLREAYAYMEQNDTLQSLDGRGIWRDRQTFNAAGTLERRFTERWHANVNAQYDWLDYANSDGEYAPLYGWNEWSVGGGAGYVLSKWTDVLVDGGYSRYINHESRSVNGRHYDNNSETWTIQGGFGSHATERISYRALAGWSILDYGGVSDADNGWVYTLSGNWRIVRNLQWSLLGSSYYQPSERALGTAIKVYTISTGLSYLMFGDRLNLTGDVAWRYEESAYNDTSIANEQYDEDVLQFRVGATYIVNRWMSLFGNVSYEDEQSDKSFYEYDRFRATIGVRLHY